MNNLKHSKHFLHTYNVKWPQILNICKLLKFNKSTRYIYISYNYIYVQGKCILKIKS